MNIKIILTGVALSSLTFLNAHAEIITFDDLSHGAIVTDQYLDTAGLNISADNPNRRFDLAIIFNSNEPDNGHREFDDDLIGPPTHAWASGNIKNKALGNLLILAENDRDRNRDGIIDFPDDEGKRPAGSFTFDFVNPITELGFDIVDVERVERGGYYTKFFQGDNMIAKHDFSDYLDSNSAYYDPSLAFGNNSANAMPTVSASSLGIESFDKVQVHLGGSGGVTNLHYLFQEDTPPPPRQEVPLPNTFFNMLMGLGLFAFLRKKLKI